MRSYSCPAFCVLFSLAIVFASTEKCSKPEAKPYEIKMDKEHAKVSAKTAKRYEMSNETVYTVCLRFKFKGSGGATYAKIPTKQFDMLIIINKAYLTVTPFISTMIKIKDYKVQKGKWHHLCLACGSDNCTLYINGTEKVTTKKATTSHLDRRVDAVTLWYEEKSGKASTVTELRYYDKKLNADDVKAIACNDPKAPKDLIEWDNLEWCGPGLIREHTAPKPPGCN